MDKGGVGYMAAAPSSAKGHTDGPGRGCGHRREGHSTIWSMTRPVGHFFLVQPKGGVPCSSYSTRDNVSESRVRVVHHHDDPTNDCGSGSDTPRRLAESDTRLCSGRLPRP